MSAQLPFRPGPNSGASTPLRRGSFDPRNEVHAQMNHYIGIDVGTGSARACIINEAGDIVGLSSENIGLWQPQTGYYVRFLQVSPIAATTSGFDSQQEQSTTDIWRCICLSVHRAMTQNNIDPASIRGIGFDATCSLAVFTHDTDEPVSVTSPTFSSNDHNVVLWLDHRPVDETKKINATKHNLLRYVGGTMSIEMEIPKVLWLKNNMPKELFDRCKFYDLTDALEHIATGNEKRSFCSVVCKQGYVPVGVDGSVKGWQEDFLRDAGLEDLAEDNFKRMGGVNGVVSLFPYFLCSISSHGFVLEKHPHESEYPMTDSFCNRTANTSPPAKSQATSAQKQPQTYASLPASQSAAA